MHCLYSFGFTERFTSWIWECISTPKFSISRNGASVGYFERRKGLRQGDPISLYLFVIAMEVFSKLMEEAALGSVFQYHPKCEVVKLTHLCFANDVLIFSKASFQSEEKINQVLLEFATLSGLQANPSKSTLFCAGISSRVKGLLLDCLKMKEGKLPVRYLGVPLFLKSSELLIVSVCRLNSLVELVLGWLSISLLRVDCNSYFSSL